MWYNTDICRKKKDSFQEYVRQAEPDKVSVRIAKILSEKAFSFTPNEYLSIHRKLFTGIYSHAGKSVIILLPKGMGA